MKKILIVVSIVLSVSSILYVDHRFGLLSIAGLNSKGLPIKKVEGNLKDNPTISSVRLDHSKWTNLLEEYVTDEGRVDYDGFLRDKSKLDEYIKALSAQLPTNNWSVQELLAYYINMYNAQTVNLILRNYPLKSIKDIDGPWTTDFITIGGKELSLGALEHSILRKMNEPRIHFAINCASASCPILYNKAYVPEKLDEQLHAAAFGFVNSKRNTISEKRLKLSRLFKWYKGDFDNGEVIKFIGSYNNVDISSSAEIEYKEYDWSLNNVH